MGGSNYLHQKIADLVLGGTAYSAPSSVAIALWTAAAETNYSGYARQTISCNGSSWTAPAPVEIAHSISPVSDIVFPGPTADPSALGDLVEIRVYDDAGTPNLLFTVAIAPKTLSQGSSITLPAADFRLQITGSGLSNAMEIALLNHIFRGTAYTPATNHFFDIYNDGALPATNGTGGTLTNYGGYAQQSRANNGSLWAAATINGAIAEKALTAAISFPNPTSNASNNAGGCAIWADAGRTSLVALLTFPPTPLQTADLVELSAASKVTFSAAP